MDDTLRNCLILIPALPLAAAGLTALLGPKLLRGYSHLPVVLALIGSFACSVAVLREIVSRQSLTTPGGVEEVVSLWTWADVQNAYQLKANPPAVLESEAGWRNFRVEIVLRADSLTAIMLSMVTFVSSLVAIYASGYMAGDRGYWRFFAYIGLFVFSMTMLVSVSNFVLLFVFWEAVGVCSYLLIGFWYQKPEAAAAGKKAFLVNRVGDFAFTAALFLIWCTYGTLNYHDSLADGTTDPAQIAATLGSSSPDASARQEPRPPALIRGVLGKSRIAANAYATDADGRRLFGIPLATAICLLLLLGACGKSAQFPLHVWLPDAMEGPTPVSALIHAATMVTAGVYMVARCTPLFAVSPAAQLVVAVIGGFTALLAGLIALTQFDLKRVLAYSTISQLGYMFLALGAGTFAGVTSGMYHLFTHAFFKALLFLGAGSVMHAMGGVIDMRQFGGLRRLMPWTYVTFLLGCVTLSGVFPFAGFWSKDAVLASVHDKVHAIEHEQAARHGHHADESASRPLKDWSDSELTRSRLVYQWLYYGAVFTAFLTAFYTFRAFAMTFHGEERIPAQAGHHAHESPPVMLSPLLVLAVCSVVIGVACIIYPNPGANRIADMLSQTPSLAAGPIVLTKGVPEFHLSIAGVGTVAALAGIGLALFLYLGPTSEARYAHRVFDMAGVERWTDPQWVAGLERVWWIGAATRFLRRVGVGWAVVLIGYALGAVALVLAVPLVALGFLTPYRLSRDKFYFDELYAALVVWPLRVAADVLAWIDRWIVDGLVDFLGRIPPAIGTLMRPLQMGLVQFYALAMVLGMLILVAARMLWAA